MTNKIILKKSSVPDKAPVANDLDYGELAINYADGKLYYKSSTNTISAFTANITSGGVTSVAATSSDLTISGSPITSAGTLTFALNTVPVSKGGTGATTANDALNALLPSQAASTGSVLVTNGTTATWSVLDVSNVMYVTKDGNDTIADGSISKPFLTIGSAMSYINTNYPVSSNSGTPVVIMLAPGEYSENVTINRFLTNIWGYEGKSKLTRIIGTITIEGASDYDGIFNNSVTLNNLFLSSTSNNNAVVLTGSTATNLEITECVLYSSGTGNPLLINNTAAGGNRFRLTNSEINAVGNASAADISNVSNGLISITNSSSASTSDAWKFSNSTLTIGYLQLTTANATNCISINGTSTVSIGQSSLTSTKSNGNGVYVSSTSVLNALGIAFNIPTGTGNTVYGPAGSVYVRGGNYSVFGTNTSIGSTLTALNMSTTVQASDLTGTVSIARGGTGQTSFSSGYIRSSGSALSSTATIAASDVSGTVSASNAVSNIGSVASTATHYVSFVSTNTTSTQSINSSSSLKYVPSSGALSANEFTLQQGNVGSISLLTTTTASNQVLDSISSTAYRTAKYIVQVDSNSAYQSSEIMLLHDDSTAYINEYSIVKSTTATLATFSGTVSNGSVQLLVTPANAITSIRAIRTAINV
jgi:hypothetical protein